MQRRLFLIGWPIVVAIVAGVAAVFIANSQVSSRFQTADQTPLWAIQPAVNTVMMEYAMRFENASLAADAGNWDMAAYQVNEMGGIQRKAETTRPARAEALQKFKKDNLDPLLAAAKAKDAAAFASAYDKAVTGCNQCHGDTKDSAGNNFRWIKIMRPTSPAPFSNVDWKAQ